ncbi:unnamed protein product [Acanthoscelides obtectus]|uniref:Protein NDUFAF4 homolog n=1 Tax=Acanthoscelides obtectus TaxID=200917 RepID=A0A9P0MA31_ACAOB|nr:unnamed protein product [Acanthoscelides obtectus]CAK1674325.1 Protein NDUFAF4 homolog [Acanthoscelides obtectus]
MKLSQCSYYEIDSTMGKVLSSIRHPFRNFNLESRAHKVISQEKPKPAPWRHTDQIEIERLMKEHTKEYEESLQKHEELDKHLKQVYVTSTNPDEIPNKKNENPDRPLPTDRTTVQPFLYGMKEPERIPAGKSSLKGILELISLHQNDPKIYNAKKIAEDTMIPENTIKNILKYYRVFEVYIPQERQVKAKFAGPSLPRVEIIKQIRKELPAPSNKRLPPPSPSDKDKT